MAILLILFNYLEIGKMQNEIMNLYKEMTANTINSVKRLTDLNTRTFETMSVKQVEIMQNCVDNYTKQTDILSGNSKVEDMLASQNEFASQCSEQFSNSMVETSDILKTAQEELTTLISDSVNDMKQNMEDVTEMGKQAVNQASQAKEAA